MKKYLFLFFLLFFLSCQDKGDTTPPSVKIISPENGSIVNEIVAINCEATDDEGIQLVSFFINDNLDSFLVSEAPYSYDWNTNSLEDASYSIKAKAMDLSGNVAEASEVIVTVDNSLSYPNSVEIIDISYTLTQMTIKFSRSSENDFKSYKIYTSDSDSSGKNQLGEILEIEDTVFTTTNFNPTQPSWYYIEVNDFYGYSTFSSGYYILDNNPSIPGLLVPKYNNGNLKFLWTPCPDNDFYRYNLYESLYSDMSVKNLIISKSVRDDTSYSVIHDIMESQKYYQLEIEDEWGSKSYSEILEASVPFSMVKTYGGVLNQKGYAINKTFDGGYIIVGSTTAGAGGTNVWILKINGSGQYSWSRTYGGEENDIGKDIIQTSDGGFLLTGYTKSYSADGNMDLWLIKTDQSGQTCIPDEDGNCTQNSSKWIRSYGSSGNDFGNSVIETIDGNYVVAGKNGRIPSIFAIMVDQFGDKIWDGLYGYGPNDVANSIIENENQGFFLIGKVNNNNSVDNLCLLSIDNNGQQQNLRIEDNSGGDDVGHSIVKKSDGSGYVLSGANKSYNNSAWSNMWMLTTDILGETDLNNHFGDSYTEVGNYAHQTPDNGYIISGFTESFGQGLYDIWVVKTDSFGEKIFSHTIGGGLDEKALGGTMGHNGELIIVGYTKSFSSGDDEAIVIIMNPNYQP